MSIFERTPALRWLAPLLAAVVLLGGGWAVNALTVTADEGLEPRTAAELLVDVQNARLDGLSGTIVHRANLGIPDLPGVRGSGSSDLGSLVSGTHTLRVWYSGPDKARIALLGRFGESDIVRNGEDLWVWSSDDRSATHYTLPAGSSDHQPPEALLPRTPQEAAAAALRAIDPSTKVSTTGTATVAERAAYELVLEPRDSASLVEQVRIAVDGETKVPLRVQVYAEGVEEPALEIGFTHFDPNRPEDTQFRFNPPPGTKVTEHDVKPDRDSGATDRPKPDGRPGEGTNVVGEGWTSVVVTRLAASSPEGSTGSAPGSGGLQEILQALPRVSGSWGSGRLLEGNLFSVLLTEDGRLVAGAVPPQRLYAALGSS